MIELLSEDIEFLKELYAQNSLDLYFFHEKYQLSPFQLARTIQKFEDNGLIVISGNQITLNEYGRNWIFGNRKYIFLRENVKYWKLIPENMKQPILGINELYIPNRKTLDKEIFKNIEDGK